MEKRLLLAAALSMVILLSWSTFVSKTYHIENKEVIGNETKLSLPLTPEPRLTPIEKSLPPPESVSQFSQSNFDVVLDESNALIKEVIFKNYGNYAFSLRKGFLLVDEPGAVYKKIKQTPNEVIFEYVGVSKKITKRFIFAKDSYSIGLELKIKNLSNLPVEMNLSLVLGSMQFSVSDINSRYQDVAIATADKTNHYDGRKELLLEEVKFLSLRDRYFCAIIQPSIDKYSAFVNKVDQKSSNIGLSSRNIKITPQEEYEENFHIYLGPQDLKSINKVDPNWAAVIYYGKFDFIAQILLQMLGFFHGLVHNWGVAIIMLSLVVYFVLFPLTLKQMRSMKEMQAIQPKVEELRNTYKDNSQKLNKEILELYRAHKVNPFGGCLPLLLQMPIFFALYQALMRSVFLKGAGFLWIKDLSEPDRLFMLPFSLPALGNELNILPIIMSIEMFVQQKFSMASSTSGSAEQQKMMLVIMPIIFAFVFYHMPAGLVMYWFINSTLMLVYQLHITKSK